jgi:hypothetical protein
MSLWTEIINTALIGCERKPLSLDGAAGKLGGLLAQLDQNDREGSLLGAAALVSLHERAGTLPLKDALSLPEACDPDDAPRCSERAAVHLAMMLRGEFQELLPEWLAKVAASEQRAPEELGPQLLELGQAKPEFYEFITPVLGRRGKWLAVHNPDWRYAVSCDEETFWDNNKLAHKREFIKLMRKQDPARARALLSKVWEQETPKDRAEYLSFFTHGLSSDDEPLLERALDGQWSLVREPAASLLAALPDSAFVGRMIERARQFVSFRQTKRGKVEIEIVLPAERDAGMVRDGIAKTIFSQPGEKAGWLQQILEKVPLRRWQGWSQKTPQELVKIAQQSEWKDILMNAWRQAASRSGDVEWIECLMAAGKKNEGIVKLLAALPLVQREKAMANLFQKTFSSDSWKVFSSVLNLRRWEWSEEFSRRVINGVCLHIEKLPDWMWRDFSTKIACCLNPQTLSVASVKINAAAQRLTKRAQLDRFLGYLQSRDDMLKEINQ